MRPDPARPVAGSSAGCAIPDSCVSVFAVVPSFAAPENYCACTQAKVVNDHAEARHQTVFGPLDLTLAGLTGQLADRLGHAEEAAGGSGLAGGQLAATGVAGETAVVSERIGPHELR